MVVRDREAKERLVSGERKKDTKMSVGMAIRVEQSPSISVGSDQERQNKIDTLRKLNGLESGLSDQSNFQEEFEVEGIPELTRIPLSEEE